MFGKFGGMTLLQSRGLFGKLSLTTLGGGENNPFRKYERQDGFIFPTCWGGTFTKYTPANLLNHPVTSVWNMNIGLFLTIHKEHNQTIRNEITNYKTKSRIKQKFSPPKHATVS